MSLEARQYSIQGAANLILALLRANPDGLAQYLVKEQLQSSMGNTSSTIDDYFFRAMERIEPLIDRSNGILKLKGLTLTPTDEDRRVFYASVEYLLKIFHSSYIGKGDLRGHFFRNSKRRSSLVFEALWSEFALNGNEYVFLEECFNTPARVKEWAEKQAAADEVRRVNAIREKEAERLKVEEETKALHAKRVVPDMPPLRPKAKG